MAAKVTTTATGNATSIPEKPYSGYDGEDDHGSNRKRNKL
jgi:hypothetical protein